MSSGPFFWIMVSTVGSLSSTLLLLICFRAGLPRFPCSTCLYFLSLVPCAILSLHRVTNVLRAVWVSLGKTSPRIPQKEMKTQGWGCCSVARGVQLARRKPFPSLCDSQAGNPSLRPKHRTNRVCNTACLKPQHAQGEGRNLRNSRSSSTAPRLHETLNRKTTKQNKTLRRKTGCRSAPAHLEHQGPVWAHGPSVGKTVSNTKN